MAKTPAEPARTQTPAVPAPAKTETPTALDLNKPHIQQAIAQGQALIKEGQSKANATRAMYPLLREEAKEVIIAAFVAGAGLTALGAQTYFYNCRRKLAKAAKKPGRPE